MDTFDPDLTRELAGAKCWVYWIHTKNQIDILQEGYVGISKHPFERIEEHKKTKGNVHVHNAMLKYGDDICIDLILQSNREFCLYIENKLRPSKGIGWNIVPGGGDPPDHTGIPKSDHMKHALSAKKIGEKHPWTAKYNREHKRKEILGKFWYYDVLTQNCRQCDAKNHPDGWIRGYPPRVKKKMLNNSGTLGKRRYYNPLFQGTKFYTEGQQPPGFVRAPQKAKS